MYMSLINLIYKLRHKSLKDIRPLAWLSHYANARFSSSGTSLSPLRVFINLNNACNARCMMCDVGLKKKNSMFHRVMVRNDSQELEINILERFFTDISAAKPLIAFNGVEPTLYKNLVRAVGSAKKLGMKVQITTNGILLPNLAEELFGAGLDSIWVSLDGPPEIHDEIRGVKGAFDKAFEGMRILDGLKKKRGGKGPSINVVSTVFHANQSSIYDLIEILSGSGIGINEVLIQHLQFIDANTAKRHNEMFPQCPVTEISSEKSNAASIDLAGLLTEVHRIINHRSRLNIRWKPHLAKIKDLETYYLHPERFVGVSLCMVFWREIQVLVDGSLTGSQRCFPLDLGNIIEQPFSDIWNGEKMKKWRLFLRNERALPACSRCCSIL